MKIPSAVRFVWEALSCTCALLFGQRGWFQVSALIELHECFSSGPPASAAYTGVKRPHTGLRLHQVAIGWENPVLVRETSSWTPPEVARGQEGGGPQSCWLPCLLREPLLSGQNVSPLSVTSFPSLLPMQHPEPSLVPLCPRDHPGGPSETLSLRQQGTCTGICNRSKRLGPVSYGFCKITPCSKKKGFKRIRKA